MAEVDDEVVVDNLSTTVPMAISRRAIMIILVSDRDDQEVSDEQGMVADETDDQEVSEIADLSPDMVWRRHLPKISSVNIPMVTSLHTKILSSIWDHTGNLL